MNIEHRKHDIPSNGFNVDPELLAHDLAILAMYKSNKVTAEMSEEDIYNIYKNLLNNFELTIEGRTRHDGALCL